MCLKTAAIGMQHRLRLERRKRTLGVSPGLRAGGSRAEAAGGAATSRRRSAFKHKLHAELCERMQTASAAPVARGSKAAHVMQADLVSPRLLLHCWKGICWCPATMACTSGQTLILSSARPEVWSRPTPTEMCHQGHPVNCLISSVSCSGNAPVCLSVNKVCSKGVRGAMLPLASCLS